MIRLNHSVCRLARRSTRKVAKGGLVARSSGLTQWASAKHKPEGPGRFEPNPSAFILSGPPARPATKPLTLAQTITGRMFQSNHETLSSNACIQLQAGPFEDMKEMSRGN